MINVLSTLSVLAQISVRIIDEGDQPLSFNGNNVSFGYVEDNCIYIIFYQKWGKNTSLSPIHLYLMGNSSIIFQQIIKEANRKILRFTESSRSLHGIRIECTKL